MTVLTFDFTNRIRADDAPSYIDLEAGYEWPLFVDWLTISQVHPGGGLPLVAEGFAIHEDLLGEHQFTTVKRFECEGSFDSTMYIRCDGDRVEFHGNPARWNRADNVFGYTWEETMRRVNRLLGIHQLPPFTVGRKERYHDRGLVWLDGARISRIDITVNYVTGSEENAQRVIHLLGQHHRGRQLGKVTPDGASVIFGEGSKYVYGKAYLKHVELLAHRKKKSGKHVDDEVIEWCRSNGIVREEFGLKSRFLTQNDLCWLGEVTLEKLHRVYRARSQMTRLKELEVKDTSHLSAGARGTLARHEQGEPHGLSRPTYYRHRKEILDKCGIDISVPRNVEKVVIPTKVIEIQAVVAPEWYRRKYG
ncbi:phage/plasmid replication domain-containing protein [Hydrocarboniphaga sp.]|uniref:phage/plasmid replication domain-containing protein n=1 Tax=Hydrocarboniphaga sp. TaxID=2033016 RepID=UPI002AB9F549|nr:phage/plasmid replication protein [Hydrocarboniphaga sp.]MDZ4080940.1 phage/plasmid replication protein [Hydrocarboniphaga sp.]